VNGRDLGFHMIATRSHY